MNIFTKLWHATLTYKLYNAIKSTVLYIRDYHYISNTLYSEEFKMVLKKYLNLEVDTDWLGRLYGIINPMIDINGHFNINNSIIEINGDLTNNNDQVQYWAYKQLRLVSELFRLENLYDYINMTIEHVGPLTADNYLIVFDMTSRQQFSKAIKNLLAQISIYTIIGVIVIMCI